MNPDYKTGIEMLLVASGVLFALFFLIRWWESAPRKWPQASGLIITSRTNTSYYRGMEMATPVIEYEFNYQGQSCKTSHWRFGNYSGGSAEPILSRYRVGSSVTVYVNRRRPEKSVLEAEPTSLCWVAFGFGILFLALAGLVMGATRK